MPVDSIKATRALVPLAAYTTAQASNVFKDYVLQFARIYINVTAASGTGGLTVQLQAYDPISLETGHTSAKIALNTGGGAITATGLYVIEFMPTAQTAAGNIKETVSRMLPFNWGVTVSVGDSSSYTYSVSIELFPG